MIGLWRKDLPWLAVFGAGGAVALALTVAAYGFLQVFVMTPHRLEELFFLAGALGLALGVVAVIWDDLLGTRDFLRQRPIAAARFAAAPIAACVAVLTAWTAVVPVLAWVFAAFHSEVFAFGHWRGLPDIEANLAVAWPATAIGCLAAALPVTPLLRLVVMAALVAIVGCSLDLIASLPDGWNTKAGFVATCIAMAVPAFAAAWYALRQRYDPDRPWSPAARALIGGVVLVATALVVAGLVAVGQHDGLRNVQVAYPQPILRGDQVLLARRVRVDDEWFWQPCDSSHVPVGSSLPHGDANVTVRWPGIPWMVEIEAPHWRGFTLTGWFRNSELLVDEDGSAWVFERQSRSLRRTGIGAEHRRLPQGIRMSRIAVVGAGPGVQRTLVGSPDTGGLWLFDESRERFEPAPLPDGDRFVRFDEERRGRITGDPTTALLIEALLERDNEVRYVRGANRTWVLHDGGWRPVEVAEKESTDQRPEAEVTGADMLEFSITVPAGAEPAFRHRYAPRTIEERLLASLPMALALVRPPALQVTSFLSGQPDGASTAWNDPLLAGGKRWFLFVLCLGTGALAAFAVARVLRRRGADAATRRFWTAAALCTGPVGVFVALLCEPARAHAQRAATSAPTAPRILSSVTVESNR